jgi:hypothetical protein
MPTKKGSSKASKLKKASNKMRRSPLPGGAGRAQGSKRIITGRVTATGAKRGKASTERTGARKGTNSRAGTAQGRDGVTDRKALNEGARTERKAVNAGEGSERVRL